MSLVARVGLWLGILLICVSWSVSSAPRAYASEAFVREILLSLASPSEIREKQQERNAVGNIEKLLSIPMGTRRFTNGLPPQVFTDRPGNRNRPWASGIDDRTGETLTSDWFRPGRSVIMLHESRARLASLRPMIPAASRRGRALLDSEKSVALTGNRVGATVYTRLEIRVNHSAYRLELYGFRQDKEELLYFAKVGLGSPYFPTPRGSYFITRIFDDKPLWIPPQNRWWAYGQMPSRSVYGGHMMPFFKKVRMRSAGSVDHGLDRVAPRMKMVDAGMYRIHGTNSPWSVGSGQSHGCVRMKNRTVGELADKLKMYVGTINRGRTANGPYVNLARPVKLILY